MQIKTDTHKKKSTRKNLMGKLLQNHWMHTLFGNDEKKGALCNEFSSNEAVF